MIRKHHYLNLLILKKYVKKIKKNPAGKYLTGFSKIKKILIILQLDFYNVFVLDQL